MGRTLIPALIQKYGKDSVIGTDLTKPDDKFPCKFMLLNIMHEKKFEKIVHDNKVNTIIHFAAILSAAGEKPNGFEKAKEINIRGLENVFDVALKHKCM